MKNYYMKYGGVETGDAHYKNSLKAPYSSKIDIFAWERFDKLTDGIKSIIKCGIWQPIKFQSVSRFWHHENTPI